MAATVVAPLPHSAGPRGAWTRCSDDLADDWEGLQGRARLAVGDDVGEVTLAERTSVLAEIFRGNAGTGGRGH